MGFAFQDFQGDAEVETAFGPLGLGDHVGLKRGEIVGQVGHGGGKPAGQPQFARHEVDGIGKAGGGQDFLADGRQQVLRGHALLHPLSQAAEEVYLLDVFFAVQGHGRRPSFNLSDYTGMLSTLNSPLYPGIATTVNPTDDTLAAALVRHGIELPEPQIARLEQYCRLLWEWNDKLNLTRHTDYEKFVGRDLVDSLAFAQFLDQGERILDVGTGGGVPGVLLAILRDRLARVAVRVGGQTGPRGGRHRRAARAARARPYMPGPRTYLPASITTHW